MPHRRIIGLTLAVCWTTSTAATDAYKIDPGPFAAVAAEISLPFPVLDKQLPLRIAYPAVPGLYPVIVFSHGGGCPKDMYLRLSDHWASHGYVVILPWRFSQTIIEKHQAYLDQGGHFILPLPKLEIV